jgi:hypothetical protein
MIGCIDQITSSLEALEGTHELYLEQLIVTSEKREAKDWFNARKELAEKVIEDMKLILQNKSIPSVTAGEGTRCLLSELHKMLAYH